MADNGWTFQAGDGVIADPLHSAEFMHQIYTAAMPNYSGRVTVPVLWDKHTNTIVSNESPEIIRVATLMILMSAYTKPLTTACINAGLQQRRKRMKRHWVRCSIRSIGRSPRQTGDSLLHWYDLTRCTLAISNATSGASWIIRICQSMCVICINSRALQQR